MDRIILTTTEWVLLVLLCLDMVSRTLGGLVFRWIAQFAGGGTVGVPVGWWQRFCSLAVRVVYQDSRTRTADTLELAGFDPSVTSRIRKGFRPEPAVMVSEPRPDLAFIERAPSWALKLSDEHARYSRLNYYVDLFDTTASAFREEDENAAAVILTEWVRRVQERRCPQGYDIILVPKSGNVLLAGAVGRALAIPVVLHKDRSNHGSVNQMDASTSSIVNFEGLRSYLMKQVPSIGLPIRPRELYVLLLDGSCKDGSDLLAAKNEFNDLIPTLTSRFHVTFQPIREAVVMYRVICQVDDWSKDVIDKQQADGFELHALVALQDNDMAQLYAKGQTAVQGRRHIDLTTEHNYKNYACCRLSRQVYDGEP